MANLEEAGKLSNEPMEELKTDAENLERPDVTVTTYDNQSQLANSVDNQNNGLLKRKKRKQNANQLAGRVNRGRDLTGLKASGDRTTRNRIALATVPLVAGGVAMGAGTIGAAIGAAIGGAATIWLGPGALAGAGLGAAIGYGIGAGIGALATLFVGVKSADYASATPQRWHLHHAIRTLDRDRGGFTKAERMHLEDVTDEQWRTLLHVPSSKLFGSGQVKGEERRQRIREALVLHVALHGLKGAAGLKERLIAAANRPASTHDPDPLQSEINQLKASDLRAEIHDLRDGGTKEKAKALRGLIDHGGGLLTRPSSSMVRLHAYAPHFGLNQGLRIVQDLQRRQDRHDELRNQLDEAKKNNSANKKDLQSDLDRKKPSIITERDRQDLIRALNPRGLEQAFDGKGGIQDPLEGHVGKEFTPELKHKIAQALYKQYGVKGAGGQPYNTSPVALQDDINKPLRKQLDPTGYAKDNMADDDIPASFDAVDAKNKKRRQILADAEIDALAFAANAALKYDIDNTSILQDVTEEIAHTRERSMPPSTYDVPTYTSLLNQHQASQLANGADYNVVTSANNNPPQPEPGQFDHLAVDGSLDLDTIIGNKPLWQQFAKFAKSQYSDENIRAYIEFDQFRRQFDPADAESNNQADPALLNYAIRIYNHYVKQESGNINFGDQNQINIDGTEREKIRKALRQGDLNEHDLNQPPLTQKQLYHLFDKAQTRLASNMAEILPRFEKHLQDTGAISNQDA